MYCFKAIQYNKRRWNKEEILWLTRVIKNGTVSYNLALSTSFQSTPKSHTFSWTFNLRLSSSPAVAITLQWHITVAKHYITLKGTAANSMGEKQTHQSKERSERPVNMNFPESHGPLPAVRLETAASVRAVGTAAEI